MEGGRREIIRYVSLQAPVVELVRFVYKSSNFSDVEPQLTSGFL